MSDCLVRISSVSRVCEFAKLYGQEQGFASLQNSIGGSRVCESIRVFVSGSRVCESVRVFLSGRLFNSNRNLGMHQ